MAKLVKRSKYTILLDAELKRRLRILSAYTGHNRSRLVDAALFLVGTDKLPEYQEPKIRRKNALHSCFVVEDAVIQKVKLIAAKHGVPDWKMALHAVDAYVNTINRMDYSAIPVNAPVAELNETEETEDAEME